MRRITIQENPRFIGRDTELRRLIQLGLAKESSIIVVYGRRRVGKTELLEQAFRKRNVIKLEGVEGLSEIEQRTNVLSQLSEYLSDPLIAKLNLTSWSEFFQFIAKHINKGVWTLYFEEVQWLANYQSHFIAELKYVWDNLFRKNKDLIMVLCGSSPSFMLQQVVHSKSLYNRSQYELPLQEFNLIEAKHFMDKRSDREVMDAYLTVGGIPEYLKWVNRSSSVFVSLCQESFRPGGFFLHEYGRIFTSSLANNKHYKNIIEYLSKIRFATRSDLQKHCGISSGGALSTLLEDLELCGFIEKYTPYNLQSNSLLTRYCICDAYLQFYYKFIKPVEKDIENGRFQNNPVNAIKTDTYHKWLGFAFERLCRRKSHILAKILGFESVHYNSGVFFNRKTEKKDNGYQIDLVYDRDDKVYTLCEIKYLQSQATSKIIAEFEKKLALFPNPKNRTIHKVLITTEGADQGLKQRAYFDRIITLTDLFDNRYY